MSDMKLEQAAMAYHAHRAAKKSNTPYAIEREARYRTDVTLTNLHSSFEGLTHAEASARLNDYGRMKSCMRRRPLRLSS